MKTTFVLSMLIALTGMLSAHPASVVRGEFNLEDNLLHVYFTHNVKDPASHFISEVSVELNRKEIINQKLTSQESETGGSLVYKILEAKAGDKIRIRTTCSRFGRRNSEFTVEKTPLKSTPTKEVQQDVEQETQSEPAEQKMRREMPGAMTR